MLDRCGELERLIRADIASGRATSETPRSFLLRQKVRSGVVLSSVRKALIELVGNRALWMYHRRQARKTADRDAQPVQHTA